jgi:hypothetical protein
MTHIQQDGPDLGQKLDVLRVKRPISERKLQANRANAQRSTGPRTTAGKTASRQNALKHGILSRSVDLPIRPSELDLSSLPLNESISRTTLGSDAALQEINRIWNKLARVMAFENDCAQRPDGLQRNVHLICRYERMLTRKLHAHIRQCIGECADLKLASS